MYTCTQAELHVVQAQSEILKRREHTFPKFEFAYTVIQLAAMVVQPIHTLAVSMDTEATHPLL